MPSRDFMTRIWWLQNSSNNFILHNLRHVIRWVKYHQSQTIKDTWLTCLLILILFPFSDFQEKLTYGRRCCCMRRRCVSTGCVESSERRTLFRYINGSSINDVTGDLKLLTLDKFMHRSLCIMMILSTLSVTSFVGYLNSRHTWISKTNSTH